MKYICISDIHGRGIELLYLIQSIENRIKKEQIKLVFLGDYLDRGKENSLVINILLYIKNKIPNSIILKGNHEEFFLGAYDYNSLSKFSYIKNVYSNSASVLNDWMNNRIGGLYTYNDMCTHEKLKYEYIKLIKKMPSIFIENNIVFTHAPIYTLYPKSSSLIERLWGNNTLNNNTFSYINIHGHIHQHNIKPYPNINYKNKKINVSHYPNLKFYYIDTDKLLC